MVWCSDTVAGRAPHVLQPSRTLISDSFRCPLRRRMRDQGKIDRILQTAHEISSPSQPASSASSTVRGGSPKIIRRNMPRERTMNKTCGGRRPQRLDVPSERAESAKCLNPKAQWNSRHRQSRGGGAPRSRRVTEEARCHFAAGLSTTLKRPEIHCSGTGDLSPYLEGIGQ